MQQAIDRVEALVSES